MDLSGNVFFKVSKQSEFFPLWKLSSKRTKAFGKSKTSSGLTTASGSKKKKLVFDGKLRKYYLGSVFKYSPAKAYSPINSRLATAQNPDLNEIRHVWRLDSGGSENITSPASNQFKIKLQVKWQQRTPKELKKLVVQINFK